MLYTKVSTIKYLRQKYMSSVFRSPFIFLFGCLSINPYFYILLRGDNRAQYIIKINSKIFVPICAISSTAISSTFLSELAQFLFFLGDAVVMFLSQERNVLTSYSEYLGFSKRLYYS